MIGLFVLCQIRYKRTLGVTDFPSITCLLQVLSNRRAMWGYIFGMVTVIAVAAIGIVTILTTSMYYLLNLCV